MTGKLSLTALAATLAFAGLGLLLWLDIRIALRRDSGTEMVPLYSPQRTGLLFARVLSLAAFAACVPPSSNASGTRWRLLAILPWPRPLP